jgi:hypothetical protein
MKKFLSRLVANAGNPLSLKKINNFLPPFFGMLMIFSSCVSEKSPELQPDNKMPVYSVQVEDATEAALIEQELKINIVRLTGNRLFYYDENNGFAQQLKQLGYGDAQKEDLYQVYKKYQKLMLAGLKDSLPAFRKKLMEQNIIVINQEKDHWIVYGTLAALNQIIKQGYTLQKIDYEPRPREVEIYVNSVDDVQKIANLGIDIFSSQAGKAERSITIHGSAFDHQLEDVKNLGFTFKIIKPRI